jgi:hypothetical protein
LNLGVSVYPLPLIRSEFLKGQAQRRRGFDPSNDKRFRISYGLFFHLDRRISYVTWDFTDTGTGVLGGKLGYRVIGRILREFPNTWPGAPSMNPGAHGYTVNFTGSAWVRAHDEDDDSGDD